MAQEHLGTSTLARALRHKSTLAHGHGYGSRFAQTRARTRISALKVEREVMLADSTAHSAEVTTFMETIKQADLEAELAKKQAMQAPFRRQCTPLCSRKSRQHPAHG
eukprot:5053962-Pleurochrysis_carterae.AAC.2